MTPLAKNVAILDEHTRLTRLETNASLYAALGTADVDLVHNTEALTNDPAFIQ